MNDVEEDRSATPRQKHKQYERLTPGGSDIAEASLFDLVLDLVKQERVQGLEPLVLLRRRGRESVLRVAVHEVHLTGPGPRDLLLSDGERPEPRTAEEGLVSVKARSESTCEAMYSRVLGEGRERKARRVSTEGQERQQLTDQHSRCGCAMGKRRK